MPLIEILALPQSRPVDVRRVLAAVNRAVADALGAPPAAVWSTWQTLPPGGYAVGGDAADAQPPASHPPVVHVHARRTPEELERVENAIEQTLTAELDLGEVGVFITTAPVQA